MEPDEPIVTRDLRREEPRSMSDELAGYAWVPRMIDKSRASRAGTLGDLMHPCPVDQRCLDRLGIDVDTFGDIVASAATGADVLRGLADAGAASAEDAWFDPVAYEEELQTAGD